RYSCPGTSATSAASAGSWRGDDTNGSGTMTNRFTRLAPAFALLFLATACGRGARVSSPPPPPPPQPFPPAARVYYDNSGGIQDSLRLVVKQASDFATIWQQATSRQASPPPAPSV